MVHKGSCHCGRVRYEVDGESPEVTECNCSICQQRGYLLWFFPGEKLKLLTPESELRYYTFNTHKIRHYFCPECGSAPFGMGQDGKGNPMAAVNVRCLEDVDLKALKIKSFDGRKL
ncbi:MAG TPA: GFA family protein [Gammaproteobacteria bacterium]|nr:GFA family protein [Gammaproteobacteria bacterium]